MKEFEIIENILEEEVIRRTAKKIKDIFNELSLIQRRDLYEKNVRVVRYMSNKLLLDVCLVNDALDRLFLSEECFLDKKVENYKHPLIKLKIQS